MGVVVFHMYPRIPYVYLYIYFELYLRGDIWRSEGWKHLKRGCMENFCDPGAFRRMVPWVPWVALGSPPWRRGRHRGSWAHVTQWNVAWRHLRRKDGTTSTSKAKVRKDSAKANPERKLQPPMDPLGGTSWWDGGGLEQPGVVKTGPAKHTTGGSMYMINEWRRSSPSASTPSLKNTRGFLLFVYSYFVVRTRPILQSRRDYLTLASSEPTPLKLFWKTDVSSELMCILISDAYFWKGV